MPSPTAGTRRPRLLTFVDALEPRRLFATYAVTDLGVSSPATTLYLNGSGQVVTDAGVVFAAGAAPLDISAVTGTTVSQAVGISDQGQVVGFASTGEFLWDGSALQPLPDPIASAAVSQVGAMNGRGDIAGTFSQEGGATHLFLYNGALQDLGEVPETTAVLGISEDGRIAGRTDVGGITQAFVYDGAFTPLGVLNPQSPDANSQAYDVNSSGVIAGQSTFAAGGFANAVISQSGALLNIDSGESSGFASSINDSGVVVGISFNAPQGTFARIDGQTVSLQTAIDSAEWSILTTVAPSVNNAGQIAVQALSNTTSDAHVLLLTPASAGTGGGGDVGGGGSGTAGTLTPAVTGVTLPSVAVPGDKGTIRYSVTNVATADASASATIEFFASTDTTVDGSDVSLGSKPLSLSLKPDKLKSGALKVALPESTPTGTYNILARLSSPSGTDAAAVDTRAAVSVSTFDVARAFGVVGGRRNVALTQTDADGSVVRFSLHGPGTGTLSTDSDGHTDLSLTGTSAGSGLTISVKGGDGAFSLDDLAVDAAVGSIKGATVNVGGDVTLPGGSRSIVLAAIGGPGSMTIGSGTPTVLKFASAADLTFASAAAVKSLTIAGDATGATLFSAPAFPKRVKLNGASLDPLADTRFHIV